MLIKKTAKILLLVLSFSTIFFTNTVSAWTPSTDPALVTTFGTYGNSYQTGQLNFPSKLAVDLNGNIYVNHGFYGVQLKFNNSGVFVGYDTTYFPQLRGYEALSNGNIIGAREYQIVDFPTGSFTLSGTTSGLARFNFATGNVIDIAVDDSDNIYAVDVVAMNVKKYDPAGNVLLTFGSAGSGPGQLGNPGAIDVDSDGYIYTTDTSNRRVNKFDSTGNFILSFGSTGSGDGQFSTLTGISVSKDLIFTTDTGNDRVQVFDKSGNFLGKFGTLGSGSLQFNDPFGIHVNENGTIVHVVDNQNHRVQKFIYGPYPTNFKINNDDTYTTSSTVTLNTTAADALGTVTEMMICNVADFTGCSYEPYATTKSWSLSSGEGTKTVYIKYKDDQLIESDAFSDTIILDTVLPTGTISINSGDANTKIPQVALTLSSSDATSGNYQMNICQVSDFTGCNYETYATSKNITLTGSQGTKTVYVRYKDLAGNESTTYADTIVYDSGQPTGSISINSGSTATNSNIVTLNLSASDTISSVTEMIICNDSLFVNCSLEAYAASKSWVMSSSEGVKTVYVILKDSGNNISQVYSDTILLDKTGPVISIDNSITGPITTSNLTITGSVIDILLNNYSETTSTTASYLGTGTNMNWNSDNGAWNYSFTNGFSFPYFGQLYSSAYITSNGRICFGSTSTLSTGSLSDTTCGPFIAPFWTDLGKGSITDKIRITQEDDKLIVGWKDGSTDNVPPSGISTLGTAQNWNADEGAWTYNLPFTFSAYGTNYSQIRISPNGTVLFGNTGEADWYKPTWESKAAMPVPRMSGASGVIDGKIYIAGGSFEWNKYKSLVIYNPQNNTWDDTKPDMTYERNSPVSAVINGKFYVAGGQLQNNNATKALEVYNPQTSSWTTKSSMNYARIGASGDSYNGKFYVVGGSGSSCSLTGIGLEVYDPVTDTWTIKTPAPLARVQSSSAKFLNGKLHLVGGQENCNDPFSNTLAVYDPELDSWEIKADLPANRAGGTTAVFNGKLLYIGGTEDGNYDSTEEIYSYDPTSNTWITLTNLPYPSSRPMAQVVDGTLYLFGGKNLDWDATDNTHALSYTTPSLAASRGTPFLAPLGLDLTTAGNSQLGEDVYISTDADQVNIQWIAEEVATGNPVSFEIQIFSNGQITYNYGDGSANMSNIPASVGISKGDTIKYTNSAYNNGSNFNLLPSKKYTYNGTNYVESNVVGNTNTSRTYRVEAVLHSNGKIDFNYGGSYNFSQIYNLTPPTVGISKGDGNTFYTSQMSGAGFNSTSTKSIKWQPTESSNISQLYATINGSSTQITCTIADGLLNSKSENFECDFNLSNGLNYITIFTKDTLNNSSVLSTNTFTVSIPVPQTPTNNPQSNTDNEIVEEPEVDDDEEEPTTEQPEEEEPVDREPTTTAVTTLQILDANNNPVVNTVVILNGEPYRTDAKGNLILKNIKPGNYNVKFKYNGQEYEFGVVLGEHEIETVKKVVAPEPKSNTFQYWYIVIGLAAVSIIFLVAKNILAKRNTTSTEYTS